MIACRGPAQRIASISHDSCCSAWGTLTIGVRDSVLYFWFQGLHPTNPHRSLCTCLSLTVMDRRPFDLSLFNFYPISSVHTTFLHQEGPGESFLNATWNSACSFDKTKTCLGNWNIWARLVCFVWGKAASCVGACAGWPIVWFACRKWSRKVFLSFCRKTADKLHCFICFCVSWTQMCTVRTLHRLPRMIPRFDLQR